MGFDLHHFLQGLDELLRSSGLDGSYATWAQFLIIIAGLLGSTGLVGYVSGQQKFRKRSFFDQMVIGVNILETLPDGSASLKLRTLVEDNLDSLLDNPILQKMVERAARRCSEENPILRLKDEEDHLLLLTKIQNAISACFAKEYMLRMLGHPSAVQWTDFVVTCERYGGLKATKVRVLVFVKEDMRRLTDSAFFKNVHVERAHHNDRLRTLRLIAGKHLGEEDIVRGRVEIPVPL